MKATLSRKACVKSPEPVIFCAVENLVTNFYFGFGNSLTNFRLPAIYQKPFVRASQRDGQRSQELANQTQPAGMFG
jgi:hypothetical protein